MENIINLIHMQRRLLASFHGPKLDGPQRHRGHQVHRQEGAQREGGLTGERDQGLEEVSRLILIFDKIYLLFQSNE